VSEPVRVRRALLSVSDKTGIVELARALSALGIELVSSGGTADALEAGGIAVTRVEDVTGAPEMMDGRVKTLHPKIHGGILADRANASHVADLHANDIEPIDLVVGNLYPFQQQPHIETIDIGGPAMVRAAAKNHAWVGVVSDPGQYREVLHELQDLDGHLSAETRRRLAIDAFAHCAIFDAGIVAWLLEDEVLPPYLLLPLERTPDDLRYGENPHQEAARYRIVGVPSWWDGLRQHSGLALSYLNYYDTEAAWRLVHDLGDRPAVAIIKHANPCGVAIADDLATAYQRALECDERSAFGGVVALNRPIDDATAQRMVAGPQADVVIAPGYDGASLDSLIGRRKNTRLLDAPAPDPLLLDVRQLAGGFLAQEPHGFVAGRDSWSVVTKRAPTDNEWRDTEFAWRVCGHVKSNAIVLAKDLQAVGIGAGQQNRVDSGEIAAKKAAGRARGGACASDAFYPFPDGVEAAADAGVAVVIQPGGAMRDDDVTARADELGLAMVFTGERHFLH
jgi:phosphoribosylaminoimidazolecarboxamide formyltransferase/IMP cyclohydrolase